MVSFHITSDRGTNWVNDFWTCLYKLTKMEQRLSTAFHPETDGSTERMNQEVLSCLRAFISYSQYEWSILLSAMLALNNRDIIVSLSTFFFTHGYRLQPIEQAQNFVKNSSSTSKRAHDFMKILVSAQEYAQAVMAVV